MKHMVVVRLCCVALSGCLSTQAWHRNRNDCELNNCPSIVTGPGCAILVLQGIVPSTNMQGVFYSYTLNI